MAAPVSEIMDMSGKLALVDNQPELGTVKWSVLL
jgi:hypothetical protein